MTQGVPLCAHTAANVSACDAVGSPGADGARSAMYSAGHCVTRPTQAAVPCEDTFPLREQGSYHPCVGQTLCTRAASVGSAGNGRGDRHPWVRGRRKRKASRAMTRARRRTPWSPPRARLQRQAGLCAQRCSGRALSDSHSSLTLRGPATLHAWCTTGPSGRRPAWHESVPSRHHRRAPPPPGSIKLAVRPSKAPRRCCTSAHHAPVAPSVRCSGQMRGRGA